MANGDLKVYLEARIKETKRHILYKNAAVADALGFINKSLREAADNPGAVGDVSRFKNKCSDPELESLMGQLLAFVEIYRGMGYHSNAIEGEGLRA